MKNLFKKYDIEALPFYQRSHSDLIITKTMYADTNNIHYIR